MEEIRDGLENNVTTNDLQQKLDTIVACLNSLRADNDLRDRIAALISRNTETHGTVTETFAVASEVHPELRETRQEISSIVNASCGLFVTRVVVFVVAHIMRYRIHLNLITLHVSL